MLVFHYYNYIDHACKQVSTNANCLNSTTSYTCYSVHTYFVTYVLNIHCCKVSANRWCTSPNLTSALPRPKLVFNWKNFVICCHCRITSTWNTGSISVSVGQCLFLVNLQHLPLYWLLRILCRHWDFYSFRHNRKYNSSNPSCHQTDSTLL